MKLIKPLAIVGVIIVILNIILFAFGLISMFLFWIIIIAIAVLAYFGIPYLKEIEEKTAPKPEQEKQ